MSKTLKKLLSLTLVLAMILSMLPSVFAADLDTTATVTFSVPEGVNQNSLTANAGDTVTLPTPEGTPASNAQEYTFAGWATDIVENTATAPELLEAGSDYVVTADATLYAVYSYKVGGSEGSSYTKVTTAPDDWSGEYVIVYEADSLIFDGSLLKPDAIKNTKSVTIASNTISAEAGDPCKVIIAKEEGGYTILTASGNYIGQTSDVNGLQASLSRAYLNSLALDEEGNADIVSSGTHLRYNATSNQMRFRFYKSTSYTAQKPISLFVKGGGLTTYYTSVISSDCSHENTTTTAEPATCTTLGTTVVTCDNCGAIISKTTEPALGHDFSVMPAEDDADHYIAPSCTDEGLAYCKCSRCDIYDEGEGTILAALGHEYENGICIRCGNADERIAVTVTFDVPDGVAQDALNAYVGETVTLPTPTGAPNSTAYNYTFIGWATDAVDNSNIAPVILKAGSEYAPTESVTLYAIYTYTIGGAGVPGEYTLITAPDQLKVGSNVVIAASDADVAMSTTQNANNRGAAAVTKNTEDNTLTITEGVAEFILGEGALENTYSFRDTAGYIYAAHSKNNYLRSEPALSNNSSWSIAIENGVATVIAQGENTRNHLRYNTQNNGIFSAYAETSLTAKVALYTKSSGTSYYTSVIRTECVHHWVDTVVAPTCTEEGYTEHLCENCGISDIIDIVEPLGHDMQAGDIVAPTCTEEGYTVYKCSRCDLDDMRDFVEALGHEMVAGTVHEPTCTDQGYTEYNCTRCDATDMGDFVDAIGQHDFSVMPSEDDADHYLAPSCTEEGLAYYKCSRCDTYSQEGTVLAALGHDFSVLPAEDDADHYLAPTCTDEGLAYYKCSRCDAHSEEATVLAALGHEMVAGTVHPATCTEDGYTDYHCTRCDATDMGDFVDALGHDFSVMPDVNDADHYLAPTCIEEGLAYNKCSRCDAYAEEATVLPATGVHTYVDGVCTGCGEKENKEAYDAALTLKSVSVDLNSDISINFNGLASIFDQYQDVYVVYSAEGKEDVIVRDSFTSSSGSDLRYNYAYNGLTALDLELDVYATVYGTKDGVLYHGDTKTYSIYKYCNSRLNNAGAPAAQKTVCANLLNYGGAAQLFKGVPADQCVNAKMTEEQKAYASDMNSLVLEKKSVVSQGTQIRFASQSLDMDSRITMNFVLSLANYTGDRNSVTYEITYTDSTGVAQTRTYTTEDLKDSGNDRYTLSFAELRSTEMRTLVTCTVYIDGVKEASYTNSVENYCFTCVNNANNPEQQKTLAKYLMLYGDSAAAAFAS